LWLRATFASFKLGIIFRQCRLSFIEAHLPILSKVLVDSWNDTVDRVRIFAERVKVISEKNLLNLQAVT
jgi:hypothetical protein